MILLTKDLKNYKFRVLKIIRKIKVLIKSSLKFKKSGGDIKLENK